MTSSSAILKSALPNLPQLLVLICLAGSILNISTFERALSSTNITPNSFSSTEVLDTEEPTDQAVFDYLRKWGMESAAKELAQRIDKKRGQDKAPLKPPRQQPANVQSNTTDTCALLFFGVPRLFKSIALPSIQRYLLTPNSNCDVFVHTYNQTTLAVTRINESAALHPEDVYLLSDHAVLENVDDFYSQHDLTWFHQHHHKLWGKGNFGSTDNMLKAWHSIQGSWNLMEAHQTMHSIAYSRVGIFRMDVFYTHEINIQDSNEPAVLPDFAWNLRTMQRTNQIGGWTLVNDRGFYGQYDYAKIWATQRFDYASTYADNEKHKKKTIYRQGIHSESLMYELLNDYKVPYEEKELCFWRLRATGVVLFEDCRVPGQANPRRNNPLPQGSQNRRWLSELMCQGRKYFGKCSEVK